MRKQILCSECRSPNVVVDAWAEWDYDEQTYCLHSTYQNSYCLDCESADTIVEVDEEETGNE